MFSVTHINPKEFALTQINPKMFSVTHINPKEFALTQIEFPVWLSVISVVTDNSQYAPSSSIASTVHIHNKGGKGSQTITWELINDSDVVLSSGTQSSGQFHSRASGNVVLTDINAPTGYSAFRIRAKIGTGDWIYSSVCYSLPVSLLVQSVAGLGANYAPGSAISCSAHIHNAGFSGNQTVLWEVIDDASNILSSGSQDSGSIGDFGQSDVSLTGITTPATYSHFRIRSKVGAGSWVYSSYTYCLPVNLSVQTVSGQMDNTYGSLVPCIIHLHNAGFAGSQTIEWEVIRHPGSAVLSSGTQSSGNVGDFAQVNVSLDGIYAPSGTDMLFRIRARITGSSTWIYSSYLLNFLPAPPSNPTPQG